MKRILDNIMGNSCTKDPSETTSQPTSQQPRSAASGVHGSIIDITGKPFSAQSHNDDGQASEQTSNAGTTGGNGNGNAAKVPRLKNIFAAPVKVMSDFVFPVYPKSESDRDFIESVVKDNFIFAGVDAGQLTNLLNAFEEFNASDKTNIITEGETGDYFYILQNGAVTFTVNGESVGEASDGGSFGDLALLYDCPRAATCTTVGSCKLWRVDQNAFRQILANSTLNKDRAVLDTLKKVPFLKGLDIEYLNKIANSVETKKFSKGTKIIKKGEVGLEFFVVKSGSVSVEDIESGGRHYDNQTLSDGAYFGERAIVKEEPRAANVIAIDDVTTLTLSRETFLEVVGPLESLMRKTNDLMVLRGIPAFARSDVKDPEYKALAGRIVYKTVPNGENFYTKDEMKGAGIYFLHTGKAKVKGSNREVTEGGYFGLIDTILAEKNDSTLCAEGNCEIGFLSKEAIESVIVQMSRIYEGSKRKPLKKSQSTILQQAIPLQALKKHALLGIGTFGKVWLVTNGTSQEAFALKIQRKRNLLQHQQVEGVIREMKVMSKLDHPMVLKLMNVYQTSGEILMLVKLIQGGELYSIMKRHRRNILPERDAKFYASGILEGLSYMHSYSILYRDLKPENVLIGRDGYPVIVDLGFAKEVPDKTFTLCGTPWYIAPEVILGRGHDKACDHWSWAILVHEMVSGDTPFAASGSDQMTLFKAIVRGNYKISKRCNDTVKDLVGRVLVTKPANRLGSLANAEQGLKTHPWLIDVDFDKLRQKRFRAPWKPTLKDALDVSEFDNWDHMAQDEKLAPLSPREQQQFSEVDKVAKAIASRT